MTSWVRKTALLLAILAWIGTTAGKAQAQGKISKDAEQRFDAGVKLLDDPDGARYAEAYTEFKAAYEKFMAED